MEDRRGEVNAGNGETKAGHRRLAIGNRKPVFCLQLVAVT